MCFRSVTLFTSILKSQSVRDSVTAQRGGRQTQIKKYVSTFRNFSLSRVWLSHSERPVKYILHLEYFNNDFLSSRNSFPATIHECKHITGFMSKRIQEMHHKRSRRS